MSVLPLSREAFADALRKGKGRAVQHIRAHGDVGVEDILLEACLRCQNYDPQSEGYRSNWLMGMLALLPHAQRYHEAILEAFHESSVGHDAEQIAGMLVTLAEQGHPGVRKALYGKFDRQEFNTDWMLSLKLIALDGLEGLLHVARVLGHRLAADPDFELDGYLQHVVDEQFGPETADEALRQAAVGAEEIRRFHDALRQPDAERGPAASYPLDAYLSDLAEGGRRARIVASRFARYGTAAEHQALFQLIERERDPSRLADMLRVFRRQVDPPGGAGAVLRFAHHQDPAVREAAIDVLERFVDERIAELSSDLLAAGSLEGIALLGRNSRPGDFDRVRELLPTGIANAPAHHLALAIVSTGRPNPHPEATGCLIWVYEESPCAFCRASAVDDLIKLGRLPDALATECHDDSVSEIRAAVVDAR